MFDGIFSMRSLVRVGIGAGLVYLIASGRLNFGASGNFLGVIEEKGTFGLDDVAKAFVIVQGSRIGANVIMGFLGK